MSESVVKTVVKTAIWSMFFLAMLPPMAAVYFLNQRKKIKDEAKTKEYLFNRKQGK